MERLEVQVISVKEIGDTVVARVRADRPNAEIRMTLTFLRKVGASHWEAAYDEALRYLDIA